MIEQTTTVKCPFCRKDLELGEDRWIQVDSPYMPFKLFCNWKHLERWITEIYEQGKQFDERLEDGKK